MKTIILCGGMGTRLREETEYKPKPMVEIGGKPILWHIMKHYSSYGYNDFILALGYKGNVIRDYFLNFFKYNGDFTVNLSSGDVTMHKKNDELNWKITLVETGDSSMTGFRTKLAGKYINEDYFMLTYGDAVADINIESLVSFSKSQNTIGTVSGVYPPSRFGDLVTDKNLVIKFKQQLKDVQNQSPINGGYFVFKKEFLNYIDNDKTIDLEGKPINRIVDEKELSIFKHEGFWHSMDTYRDNLILNKMWSNNPPWKIWS